MAEQGRSHQEKNLHMYRILSLAEQTTYLLKFFM